ncbi:MAG TPA: hypothetical protein ENJ56_08890 [Anaerolineae bacterium]|nr:hypothetical protein [Anaerolineae bacterium]
MTELTLQLDNPRLKALIKEALAELLQERRELFQPLISEVIEDAGLLAAIHEGRNSDNVSRAEIMAILAE